MVGGRIIGLITRVIMGKVGREADGGYGWLPIMQLYPDNL